MKTGRYIKTWMVTVLCLLMLLSMAACGRVAVWISDESDDAGAHALGTVSPEMVHETTTASPTTVKTTSPTTVTVGTTALPTQSSQPATTAGTTLPVYERQLAVDVVDDDVSILGRDPGTTERFHAYLIRSFSELQEFLGRRMKDVEAAKEFGPGEVEYASNYNEKLLAHFEKYTESYFADQALLLVYTVFGSSRESAEVASLPIYDSTLHVNISWIKKGVAGTADMRYQWKLLEPKQSELQGVERVEVHREVKEVYVTCPPRTSNSSAGTGGKQ